MKAPPRFYKSGSASHISSDPTSQEQSTAELLKWISNCTIKRRQIRRSTHCSNLLAEAILSSALRKAKKDLAHKQEEKRRKLRLFCLSRSKSKSQDTADSFFDNEDFELVKCNTATQPKEPLAESEQSNNFISSNFSENKTESYNDSSNSSYQVTMTVLQDFDRDNSNSSGSDEDDSEMVTDADDAEVKACLSSLESFFKELKSVKV